MPRAATPPYSYSLPAVYLAIPGTTILVDQHNTPLEDIATTFNTAQPIQYGGTAATTVAAAQANLGIIPSDRFSYPLATGTADAIVITNTSPLLALTTGATASFKASAANTGAMTANDDGLGFKAIRKIVGGTDVAMAANDVLAAGLYQMVYSTAANAAAGAWIIAAANTNQRNAPPGTAALPAFSFDADQNSGFYNVGADEVGLSLNGALAYDFKAAAQLGPDGTVLLPGYSFILDPDSGVYRIGANNLGVAVNAAKVLDVATTGLTVTGTAKASSGGVTETLGSSTTNEAFRNLSLDDQVAASALTIAIKGADGNDPSATNPVYVTFRNATAATGTSALLTLTAATSLVISSGSTMGFTNSTAGRLWIVAFNDAGTLRLGVINCLSGTSIYPLAGTGIASSTAEGGAGAADSAQVFYTGTAVTSKAYTILGYMDWASGLAAVGTWGIRATTIKLFARGDKKPGDVVQVARTETGAVATGTTIFPVDDTIPQISEGTEFMTQAITPTATPNLLRVDIQAQVAQSLSAGNNIVVALFQDATANALKSFFVQSTTAAGAPFAMHLSSVSPPTTISSTTLRVRIGPGSASTVTFNGSGGARFMGGSLNSYIDIQEIMG